MGRQLSKQQVLPWQTLRRQRYLLPLVEKARSFQVEGPATMALGLQFARLAWVLVDLSILYSMSEAR